MDSSQDGMVTLRGTDQVLGELDSSRTADSLAEVTNITNDESASVYELRVEDRTVAGLVYAETGNRVTLLATSVFPEFRGKGLAGKLLGGVLDKLRTEGRTGLLKLWLTPGCLFEGTGWEDMSHGEVQRGIQARRGRAGATRQQSKTDRQRPWGVEVGALKMGD